MNATQFGQERLVARSSVECRLRHLGQGHHGVAIGGLEDIGIESTEELDRIAMPRVPEVASDLVKRLECRRQVGVNVESMDAHGRQATHGTQGLPWPGGRATPRPNRDASCFR